MPFPSKRTQFKPGQSGNPTGHSRARRITSALLDLIAEKNAEKGLATVWLSEALKGDYKFFRELLDRTEGPIAEHAPQSPDDERMPRINIPGRKTRKSRSKVKGKPRKRKPAP